MLSSFVGITDTLGAGLLVGAWVGSMFWLLLGFELEVPVGLPVGVFEGSPLRYKLGTAVGPSGGTIDGLIE